MPGSLPSPDNPFGNPSPGSIDASAFGATPSAVAQAGRDALAGRDWTAAESAFRAGIAAWPNMDVTPSMQAGLGEALFWQKRYYEAASVHLKTHKEHPTVDTAPDNLLGLALSLAGLNQREVACATYAEVLKQYPQAEARLGERVRDEQAAARCG